MCSTHFLLTRIIAFTTMVTRVQVNYLAELTVDAAVSVRLETSRMLAEFITTLPDR